MRRTLVVAAMWMGLLATSATAATGDVNSVFPTARQVQKHFPKVEQLQVDGDDGHPALFPSCADDRGREPGPGTVRHRRAEYWLAESAGRRTLAPGVNGYRYRTQRRAATVMRRIKAHYRSCSGHHEGVEDYSTYRRVRVPAFADDRFAFRHTYGTTFEGLSVNGMDIWIRTGRLVLDVGASKGVRGNIPKSRVVRLARMTVRRAT